MARIKVKVDRGSGLTQVVTIDTSATQGAQLGSDLYLPSGQVATPASFLTWLGVTPSSGGGSSSGPSLQSILTTKGDLATRDTQVQRLGIGGQDDALRVSAGGLPEWRAGAILSKVDDTNVTLTLTGTPLKALLAAAGLTLGWTGQLAATRGGTGFGSYAAGDTLYANSTTTLAKLAIGAAGTVYRVSGGAPAWQAPAALTKTDDTNVTLTLGGSPATSLLAAASLTLGWAGTLAAPRGGTGFGSYAVGDILYASSTSALSKLAATTNGFVLTLSAGVPVWAAAAGGASGANPTASVGLTAVNGSAGTFLRSDGAPALDQGIAPTWTGAHYFTNPLAAPTLSNNALELGAGTAGGKLKFIASGGATDAKVWEWASSATLLLLRAVNDADSSVRNVFNFTRSGLAVTAAEYGNSTDYPTHTFYAGVVNVYANGNTLFAFNNGTVQAQFGFGANDRLETGTSTNHQYSFYTNNLTRLSIGAAGELSAFAIHNNASVTGNISSGTYTPTITLIAGGSGSTARVCQWMRVGNVVTVSGSVVIVQTAVVMQIGISLPIASAIAQTWQIGGFIGSANVRLGTIDADTTNDRAHGVWTGISGTEEFSFTFTYLVI